MKILALLPTLLLGLTLALCAPQSAKASVPVTVQKTDMTEANSVLPVLRTMLELSQIPAANHHLKAPDAYLETKASIAGQVEEAEFGSPRMFADLGGVIEQPTHAPIIALSYAEAEQIICAYDWPCFEALAIAWRESRFQPAAVNPYSGAAGLMQIMPLHGHSIATLQDPYANVAIAFALYQASGWTPWRMQ